MIYVWMLVALIVLAVLFYYSPKGWRTWAINAAMALMALLGPNLDFVAQYLPPDWSQKALVAATLVNGFLRWVTTTPVMQRG